MTDDETLSPDSDDDRSPGQGDNVIENSNEAEALIRRLRKWEKSSNSHNGNWKKDTRTWFDMVSGEQWDTEDKAKLLETFRQPISFNRVAPMVDAVAGAEVLNRQNVQYIPRKLGKVGMQELFTSADKWARQECDGEDEESDAFRDAVICGMGWVETFMEYDEDPQGLIKISRFDPLEAGWDPTAKKPNLVDSRFRFRRKGFEPEDVKSKWPKKADLIKAMSDTPDDDTGTAHRLPYDAYRDDDTVDVEKEDRRLVYVIQMQWWDLEDCYTVILPPAQPPQMQMPQPGMPTPSPTVRNMQPDEYKQLVKQSLMSGQPPPPSIKSKCKCYYEAHYAGGILLERKKLNQGTFTLQCITGKRDRNKNTWYGIVKPMVDPQKWANKWLSQIMHIVNVNAKGGVIAEEGSVTNVRKFEDEWSNPASVTWVKQGKAAGVQPKPMPQYPTGIDKLLEFAIGSFPQVTGISMEMLGLVDREQPGILEQNRKKSGYAILAIFFDSLRRYRKLQGRLMLHYIQNYISDGRLIRMQAEDGNEQYIPLLRQPDAVEYDIIVDEAPMSQNQKDMVWGMLLQMMPLLTQAQIPPQIWGNLIKYSPLPSTVSNKLGQAIANPSPEQQQMQQAMQQLTLDKTRAAVAKDQSSAALNMARAHLDSSRASGAGLNETNAAAGGPNDAMTAQATAHKDHASGHAATLNAVANLMKAKASASKDHALARKAHGEADVIPFSAVHTAAQGYQQPQSGAPND